jgi:hypothetical protein
MRRFARFVSRRARKIETFITRRKWTGVEQTGDVTEG